VTRNGLRVAEDLEQAERVDRLGLPLEHERLDGLDAYRVADEEAGLGADEHLAWLGGLLEPCSHVDRIARHESLALAADHDLAGVDADARLQPVLGDRGAHLRGGARRAQRIVLVRDGDPEHRHHRVADELLDPAAVALDDRAQVVEVALHSRAQRLWVCRLAECRRAHEIGEHHSHDLPYLEGGLGRSECRSAEAAKARVGGVLTTAARAPRHAPRV
jgi:hypothetical protein